MSTTKRPNPLHAAPAALLLLAACGGQDLSTLVPDVQAPARVAGMSPQGERLQATRLGGTWAVNTTGASDAGGVAFDTVMVENAEIVAYRNGVAFRRGDLVGAHLRASNPPGAPPNLALTINAVTSHLPADPNSVEWEYDITFETVGSADRPQRLCQDSANNGALPFAGYWEADGLRAGGASVFSFACHGGVIMKCNDWGYKPFTSSNATNPPTPLAPYHQTCTRLARADYCSDGTSYTMERTPIDYYDRLNIATETIDSSTGQPVFPTEAIWRVDSGSRRPGLMCLSKKRWDTIPLGGACPLTVPDPRVDRSAVYCEDLRWSEWVARGAILGNDSLYIDRGLFRWQHGALPDQYTTSQYIYRGAKPSPTGAPPSYTFADFEGAVFAEDLSQKGFVPAGSLVPLYTYQSPSRGDRFTTSVDDPNTMTHPAWDPLPLDYDVANRTLEGWLFKPPVIFPSPAPHPHAHLLMSWYSPSRHEHTTSRSKPNPAVNPDYVFVRIEGYVLYKK